MTDSPNLPTRGARITWRMHPLERRLLEEAASRTGDTLSGYVRGIALDAARRALAGGSHADTAPAPETPAP